MQITTPSLHPQGRTGPPESFQGHASDPLTQRILEAARKYGRQAYMYIEYPHKSFWPTAFGEGHLKEGLCRVKDQDSSLMLYVHFPFCQQQCFYCTCHTEVCHDYERMKDYLPLLFKEMDLYQRVFEASHIAPRFVEVHLGGGSPTLLKEAEFDALVERIDAFAGVRTLREFAIEVDPRHTDKAQLRYYHTRGINRISLGIQDFDPDVQAAINRIQPPEWVESLLEPDVRRLFSHGINFDILCGLPHQTPESIRRTFHRIVAMSPDRICFNHLHFSPEHAPHQRIMIDGRRGRPTRLPDHVEKRTLFAEGLRILLEGGYVRTGYDHFAKPGDDVAQALKANRMKWNALGVTAGEYTHVLGIGPHSTTTLPGVYAQNVYGTRTYQQRLLEGRLPVFRGCVLTQDDQIRRDVIQAIRNYSGIDYRDIEARYGIEFEGYFAEDLRSLEGLVEDGLVAWTDHGLQVTEVGREFVLLVCSYFDAYARRQDNAGHRPPVGMASAPGLDPSEIRGSL